MMRKVEESRLFNVTTLRISPAIASINSHSSVLLALKQSNILKVLPNAKIALNIKIISFKTTFPLLFAIFPFIHNRLIAKQKHS